MTEDGARKVVSIYADQPGVRDLEQAAEHLAANALTDDNRVKMFETMNTWNAGLKPFKFIVDSHNNLVMVCCLLNADGQMDGDKVNAMMNTILDYLTKEYKNVIAALKG